MIVWRNASLIQVKKNAKNMDGMRIITKVKQTSERNKIGSDRISHVNENAHLLTTWLVKTHQYRSNALCISHLSKTGKNLAFNTIGMISNPLVTLVTLARFCNAKSHLLYIPSGPSIKRTCIFKVYSFMYVKMIRLLLVDFYSLLLLGYLFANLICLCLILLLLLVFLLFSTHCTSSN